MSLVTTIKNTCKKALAVATLSTALLFPTQAEAKNPRYFTLKTPSQPYIYEDHDGNTKTIESFLTQPNFANPAIYSGHQALDAGLENLVKNPNEKSTVGSRAGHVTLSFFASLLGAYGVHELGHEHRIVQNGGIFGIPEQIQPFFGYSPNNFRLINSSQALLNGLNATAQESLELQDEPYNLAADLLGLAYDLDLPVYVSLHEPFLIEAEDRLGALVKGQQYNPEESKSGDLTRYKLFRATQPNHLGDTWEQNHLNALAVWKAINTLPALYRIGDYVVHDNEHKDRFIGDVKVATTGKLTYAGPLFGLELGHKLFDLNAPSYVSALAWVGSIKSDEKTPFGLTLKARRIPIFSADGIGVNIGGHIGAGRYPNPFKEKFVTGITAGAQLEVQTTPVTFLIGGEYTTDQFLWRSTEGRLGPQLHLGIRIPYLN